MKNRFILVIMMFATAAVIAAPLCGEEGKLDDIVVKEKDTVTLDREKEPFAVSLDHLKVIRPSPEDNHYYLTRRSFSFEMLRSIRPGRIMGEVTVSPWLNTIARSPLASFPLEWEKGKASSWKFIITDREGRPFRVFSGRGSPPKKIEWNGRDGSGKFMKIGSPYSSIFTVIDRKKKNYTFVGNSFSVNAAEHQEKDGLMLDFSLDSIFNGSKAPLEFVDGGQRLLDEGADVLKEHYPAGFIISVFCESEELALQQANCMARYLARKLVIPVDSFFVDGRKGVPGNYIARITILNKGGRADPSLRKATNPESDTMSLNPPAVP